MARRRTTDFVAWSSYRRAWVVPLVAGLVLVATSFRAETPVQPTLPPTLQNEQAGELVQQAREFDQRFADRRPGTPGSFDSAQWMLDRFAQLGDDVRAKTVPATTTSPATNRSIGLVNVEATLPGRTRELVVILAHRDTASVAGRGGDAVGQVALLHLAKELAATRDRRRTYLFVSTDAATLNGGGARALAERLSRRGGVVAVITLDRLSARGALRVDATASAVHAPPLGLVQTARVAVDKEGGIGTPGSLPGQLLQLAAPVTLREHGQLLARGLPAVTLTRGDDQLRERGATSGDGVAADVGAGLRSVQRLVATLDQLDQVQTAGKTWVASERRVYRGWALKIFVASLLVPVWVVAIDLVVRRRRTWNLFAIVGTTCRAMLAGMTSVVALWLLGAIGLLARTEDRPPNPGAFDDLRWLGLFVWVAITVGAWLLARGPDWRRARLHGSSDADNGDIVVGLLALVLIGALTLAINPFTVLFLIPTLHAWPMLVSTRVWSRRTRALVWSVGLVGPLLALATIGSRGDTGAGAVTYALHLVQTRSIPPLLGLLLGAAGGLVVLSLLAALGRVGSPALPHLRRLAREFEEPRALVRTIVRLVPRPQRMRLQLPRVARRGPAVRPAHGSGRSARRSTRSTTRASTVEATTPQARREAAARERAARRAARSRVQDR